MARSVKNSKLDSRTARDKLEPRARPYYTTLIPGKLHLGYRRRRKGKGTQGRWLVRRYLGIDAVSVGRYHEEDIGLADDFLDADGVDIFDYIQAQKRASDKWGRDNAGKQPPPGGPLTVKAALERYFEYLEQDGRPPGGVRGQANLHIVPALGSEPVDTLNTDRLRGWLADMARLPPHEDEVKKRRRRSTANRVLTVLRAALNHAFDEGHVNSNIAWGRRLKPLRDADAARTNFLSVVEAKRLINAADPAFRRLVQAALSTGARYGELTRLEVADFNSKNGSLTIWKSKSGKSRHVFLTSEGTAFFKQQTVGRSGDEIMLRKADGTAWAKGQQTRPMAAAVKRAKITPTISFHGLRHTYATLAIEAGTPLHVIAKNLGHADTRMVEKHYGHLAEKYMKNEIQKGAAQFDFAKDSKVVALGGRVRDE